MRFMRACLVVLLVGTVACGSKAKPSPSNTTPATAVVQPEDVKGFKIDVVDGEAGGPSVEGTLRDHAAKEPLQGATLVFSSPSLQGEQTTIADEAGRFTMAQLPDGAYTLTIYYNDQTTTTQLDVKRGKLVKVALDWELPASGGEVVKIEATPVVYKTATEALDHGAVDQAYALGAKDLAKSPSAKLHGMLAIAKYGMTIDAFHTMLRMDTRDPKVKQIRASLATLVSDLDEVQEHLAEAAKDPQFALELCVACMTAEGGMGLPPGALDIEHDRAGKELPEGDARRRPTFRFDHGDLAWGRAMVSFQQALGNVVLAYDWDWFENLLAGKEPVDGTKLTIKIVEPQRISKARELVLAGLQFSDTSRTEFLKETDDDREWVPSPKQKNYASPLAVDAKLYKTWEDVIGDVRSLFDSKTGISLPAVWQLFGQKAGGPTGFIDLGAMFKTPKDIVIEIGAIDRIEDEKNPKTSSKLVTTFIKELVGDGYKANMKASKLTDRLLQLRKDLDKNGEAFEHKLKYVLWLN